MAKQEYSIAQQLENLYYKTSKNGDKLVNLGKLAKLVKNNEKVINYGLDPRQVNELSNLLLNLGKLYIQDDKKGRLDDRNWLDDQHGAVMVLKSVGSMMNCGILDHEKLPEKTLEISDFINDINLATGMTNENDRKREINRVYKQELKSFPKRKDYTNPGPINELPLSLKKARNFVRENPLNRSNQNRNHRSKQNRNHSGPPNTRKP